MKKFNAFAILGLLVMSVLASVASAASVPVTIEKVWLNDREVTSGEVRGDILRGDSLVVEIKLKATANADDVQVQAEITGDEREEISARTERFEIKSGQLYFKTLTLDLPDNMDQDSYAVRIEVSDKRNDEVKFTATVDVNTDRHAIEIEDVLFSPGTTVTAGRSLLSSVRVENNGEKDEEDVKVTFSIPTLGVSDSDFMDEIESDDEKTSEELFVRIPDCAEAGDHTARVTVAYDEGTRTETEEFTIKVLENKNCGKSEGKTVITAGPESQSLVAGGNEAVYPVALTNDGGDSKTYTVEARGSDGLTARVSSSVLVVGAGETKVAYVNVAAGKDASAGEKLVTIAVKSGEQTLKEVVVKANVVKSQDGSDTLKRALQIGFVVLVVLLVVVGLIVGLSRMKGNGSESKEEETYY